MWPRRQALRALGATLALPALTPAFAQFRVEIKGTGAAQIPIVLGRFRDEDRQPQSISAIVRADLERSGIFKIIDGPAPADENGAPDYNTLRSRPVVTKAVKLQLLASAIFGKLALLLPANRSQQGTPA